MVYPSQHNTGVMQELMKSLLECSIILGQTYTLSINEIICDDIYVVL